MHLRTLRAFVEVVQQGGFSRAAKVVCTTQSSVSKSVRRLEEKLGRPLFDRIGHHSQLTAAGEIVYRRALEILAERDRLFAELNALPDLKSGLLRIGLPPLGNAPWFATLFATFRSRYPGIDLQLVEHGSLRLEDMLSAGELDIATLLAPVDQEYDWQEVSNERLTVIMSVDHPLAAKAKLGLDDLQSYPFILFEEGFALNPVVLDACQSKGFRPRIAARSAHSDFIVELVAAGAGIALLPAGLARRHQTPVIHQAPLDEPRIDVHMVLAWRNTSHLAPAARALLALAAEVLPTNPG